MVPVVTVPVAPIAFFTVAVTVTVPSVTGTPAVVVAVVLAIIPPRKIVPTQVAPLIVGVVTAVLARLIAT
jgi:hypothetical protein